MSNSQGKRGILLRYRVNRRRSTFLHRLYCYNPERFHEIILHTDRGLRLGVLSVRLSSAKLNFASTQKNLALNIVRGDHSFESI